jgi:hypothetical protein
MATLRVRGARTEPGWDGRDGKREEALQDRRWRVAAGRRRTGGVPNSPAASLFPNSMPLSLLRPRLRPRSLQMPVVRRGDTLRWAAAGIDRIAPPRHLCCGVALLVRGDPNLPCPKPSQWRRLREPSPATRGVEVVARHARKGGSSGRGWWTTGAACQRQWVEDRNIRCWTTSNQQQVQPPVIVGDEAN